MWPQRFRPKKSVNLTIQMKPIEYYISVVLSIKLYMGDITWRREDMNFIFEW